MTEKYIQRALFKAFHSHVYKFTNVYFFNNESDWLSFLSSGFCYEVEIKISRSDFKADFKKEKHQIHQSNENSSKTFLSKIRDVFDWNPSWELCREYPELIECREDIRNSWRTGSNIETRLMMNTASEIEFRKTENRLLPNKFFYAVPVGLIKKEDVPDYAGLLYVDENFRVTKIKDGKFLHKDKLDVKKLFNKTYHAYETGLITKLTTNTIKDG